MASVGIPIDKGYPAYAAVNCKTGVVYLSYPVEDSILMIDVNSRNVTNRIHANSPTKMAINSATNMVYMLCSDGIYIIDGSSNSLKPLKTGKSQSARSGLDLNPVTNTIYTTSLSVGVLTVIDAVNGSTISEVNIGKPLAGVAVDLSENKVYILSPKTVHVIDADTNQQVEEIKTSVEHKLSMLDSPNELDYVLVNPSSKLLYIQEKNMTGYDTSSNESFDLLVIDMTEKVRLNKRQLHTRPTPAGLYQHGFVVNSSNNALYTIDPNRNRLLKFDSMAKRLIETKYLSEPIAWWKRILSTGPVALGQAIAVNPLTNKVYVTDSSRNLLHEIDG